MAAPAPTPAPAPAQGAQSAQPRLAEKKEDGPAPCIHREHQQPCELCAACPAEPFWSAFELSGDPVRFHSVTARIWSGIALSRQRILWCMSSLFCVTTMYLVGSHATPYDAQGKKNGAKLLFSAIKHTSQWSSVTSRHEAVSNAFETCLPESALSECPSRGRHKLHSTPDTPSW